MADYQHFCFFKKIFWRIPCLAVFGRQGEKEGKEETEAESAEKPILPKSSFFLPPFHPPPPLLQYSTTPGEKSALRKEERRISGKEESVRSPSKLVRRRRLEREGRRRERIRVFPPYFLFDCCVTVSISGKHKCVSVTNLNIPAAMCQASGGRSGEE